MEITHFCMRRGVDQFSLGKRYNRSTKNTMMPENRFFFHYLIFLTQGMQGIKHNCQAEKGVIPGG